MNDGINPAWCSLSYVSVDNLIEVICSLGRGALLAKVDVQSAYRLVPVFPEDCWLLGMHWSGECFVDAMLPFGLRSAPKIFNTVADALQWIIRARGVDFILHYLDDFVVVGEPGSLQCHQAFSTVKEVCAELGVPLAADKSMGPTMCLTFLGIELDTSLMQIRLPAAKLAKLIELVEWWLGRSAGTKKELQSLAGHLQHACRVVRPGRCFLRRLFELIAVARRQDRFIRLHKAFRADLQWWRTLLSHWNGCTMMWAIHRASPDEMVFSDASGKWGCGAVWGNRWLQHRWEARILECSIAVKELVPIVMAAAIWGREWCGRVVRFRCDNEAVVSVINSLYSSDPTIMHLLRCLFLFAALGAFWFDAFHVPGRMNRVADAISRGKTQLLESFFLQVGAQDLIAPELPVLLYPAPDWMSPNWMGRLDAYLRRH